MKRFVRFKMKGLGSRFGLWEDHGIRLIKGKPPMNWQPTEELFDPADVRLLAPCTPSKVVAVGLNYEDHAKETNNPVPNEPILFMKPSTSVIGPK
jgi:2-keto-4-pentenoate hydratase/2-oxohepta-3-ene-1,7-dioic acid hydratase in catechol pathway